MLVGQKGETRDEFDASGFAFSEDRTIYVKLMDAKQSTCILLNKFQCTSWQIYSINLSNLQSEKSVAG